MDLVYDDNSGGLGRFTKAEGTGKQTTTSQESIEAGDDVGAVMNDDDEEADMSKTMEVGGCT